MSKVKSRASNIKPEKQNAPRKRTGPKKPKKITETYLHNAGLYYLQRYAASAGQFRKVMLRKIRKSCQAHPEQNFDDCARLVDALVQKFEETGLLNDELYTRGMVNSLRRQGKSRKAILNKLRLKGVDHTQALHHLSAFDEEHFGDDSDSELFAALTFARKKKLGPFALPDGRTPEQALGALARAGFSYDVAQKIMQMENEEALSLLGR